MVIGIVVCTRGRPIVEAIIDIIDHTYVNVLDIWELERAGSKTKRWTRVANINDNNLKVNQVWDLKMISTQRTVLADVE